MKLIHRGAATCGSLFITILISATIMALVWEGMPADPEDVKSVIALASSSPHAKAAISDFLVDGKRPNRAQLYRMRSLVREIAAAEEANTPPLVVHQADRAEMEDDSKL